MARLTRVHLQSVSESAAVEGGWQMAMNADAVMIRQAVADRASALSETGGPRRIELEGGVDLDNDGAPESSQTINEATLGDPVFAELDLNVENDPEGDIVFGGYDATEVPGMLPGPPPDYNRGTAFIPNDEVFNALLVRKRRTGEDISGGTSAERVAYLWSRGSLLDFGLKGSGIAVRGEAIVQLAPAVAVGWADDDRLPGLLAGIAVRSSSVQSDTYQIDDLVDATDAYWIGAPVSDTAPDTLAGDDGPFYLPIASVVAGNVDPLRIIGFTLVEKTGQQLTRISFDQTEFRHINRHGEFVVCLSGVESLRCNRCLARPHHLRNHSLERLARSRCRCDRSAFGPQQPDPRRIAMTKLMAVLQSDSLRGGTGGGCRNAR